MKTHRDLSLLLPALTGAGLGVAWNISRTMKETGAAVPDARLVWMIPAGVAVALLTWWAGSAAIGLIDRSRESRAIRRADSWTFLLLAIWYLYPLRMPLVNVMVAPVFLYSFLLSKWLVLVSPRLAPRRLALVAFLLLPVSLLLAGATLEVKYRLKLDYYSETQQQGVVYFDPVPYVMYKARPDQSVEVPARDSIMNRHADATIIRTNALGYRGTGPSTDTGRVRILVLGGSLVYNGSTDRQTISGRLEERLSALLGRDSVVACWNGGITGCISDQSYVAYTLDFLPYAPDIVVEIDGVNDFWTPHLYERRIGYPLNYRDPDEPAYRKWLQKHSQLYNLFLRTSKNFLDHALGYEYPYPARIRPEMEKVLEHYVGNMKRLADLNVRLGVPTFVYLQPVRGYELGAYERPGVLKEWPEHMTALTDHYYSRAWPRFQELEGNYAGGSVEVKFGELTRLGLGRDTNAFWDLCHVHDEGNGIIAERVAADVLPAVRRLLAKKGSH